MSYSRREFLKSLLALAAAGAAFHPLSALAMEQKARSCVIAGFNSTAAIVDLNTFNEKHLTLGFNPHSFIQLPHAPTKFIAIEKWGSSAAEVDFEKDTVRQIPSGEHHQFYGHGIYVPEKKAVYITRVNGLTGLGYLTAYDQETHKIVHDVQVTSGALHDCQRLADNTFMIASAGYRRDPVRPDLTNSVRLEDSALIRVDLLGTGKVVSKLTIDDQKQMINHFTVTKNGQVLALSCPTAASKRRRGDIFYSPDGVKPLRQLEFAEDMEPTVEEILSVLEAGERLLVARSHEFLSVALNADHTRAAVTFPIKRKVVLVDMTEGKVLKVVKQFSGGVAFDPERNKFVGTGGRLIFMDGDLNKREPRYIANSVRLSSAHALLVPSKISV